MGSGAAAGRGASAADVEDLLAFVAAGPSPFHVAEEMGRRLEAAGFFRLDEAQRWELAPGQAAYVVRGGSIVAFRVGSAPPGEAGFRLIGAHTDSPGFVVRPVPDVWRAGYRLVGVEVYGSPLTYTWLDRDLTLAGRVAVRTPSGEVELRPARLPGAPLRIPSLAIHLQREIHEQGVRLDAQRHLVPVWSHDLDRQDGLVEFLADHLGVERASVLAFDLVAADAAPPALGGAEDSWMLAPRLDNLLSCHAGLSALLSAAPARHGQVLVANHHEEVGSGSAAGARGPFLADVVGRLVRGTGGDAEELAVALPRSLLVSADTAHAVHPNYAERHEPGHLPRLGGGPVLKVNAGQAYASDAPTAGWFAARCADAGVPLQRFVTRGDLPCGSTIGPLTATRLGVPTVDVGQPLLSMHSCREQAATADLPQMTAALTAHLEHPAGPRVIA